MALHLRFSHRLEPLLAGLDDLLGELWTSFERPPRVVVASPSVARWLKLRLCERRGPLVGLETSTLEATLWNALRPERDERLLRVPTLQQAVLAVLTPELLEDETFGSVRRFLHPSGTLDPRRKVQFAHEIARLFLEYEYNRPSVWNGSWAVDGLDRTWPDKPYFAPRQDDSTETWQRRLHGLVFDPDGPLGGDASRLWLGLPRLHRLRHDAGWTPEGDPLLLFGIDKVSHFHRNMLLEMAQARDLHVFLQNPCSAFWEDVDTSRRRHRGRRPPLENLRFRRDATVDEWQEESLSDRVYPAAASDPLLLERWGRTSRENIALWCQAADYDFEELGEDDAPAATLLGTVQEALRRRHPGPRLEPLSMPSGEVFEGARPADGSILLLECPDRGREMETMRNQILTWLSEDPSRTFSDIVVLLPDPSRHRVEIERVFGGFEPSDPGHIPWTMLGVPSKESLWARGALSLLRLAAGPFDRPGVFAVLRNELCRRRLGVDEATVATWESWTEGAGAIRGWDAEERAEEGLPVAQHTFLAAMRRLLLAPLAGRDGALLPGSDEPVPPWRDFDSTAPSAVELFCATLERLHADRARLRAKGTLPSESVRALFAVLDAWFDVSGHPAEASIRRSLLDSMDETRLRDDQPMDLAELTEIVTILVDGEMPGSSRAWTGAVTFAPLRAGNILPHGLVLVPGLDADAFPGERSTSALDLLSRRRIVGDADVVADNRHAFLLALLSCRDRLVLSWRACDIQKDERLDPSSVVLELEDALAAGFVVEPLRRRVRLLEREAALPGELDDPAWDPLVPGPENASAVAEPSEPTSVAEPAPEGERRIATASVRHFLSDSWSFRIERDLEAREDDLPDTLGAVDEPLDSSPLLASKLRRDLFPELARASWDGAPPATLAGICAAAQRRALWDSDSPEGPQARAELRALEAWAAQLRDQIVGLRGRRPRHRFEAGCDLGLRTPGLPPEAVVELDGGARVRLSARIPAALVGPSMTDPVILLCPAKPSSKGPRFGFQRTIEPVLWSVLLGVSAGLDARIAMVPTAVGGLEELSAPPPETAVPWLRDVLRDMLAGRCEFLPARHVVDDGLVSLEELREAVEESTWKSALHAMLDPSLPGEDSGDPSVLAELVQRRFGPFLSADQTESVEEGA